eukprot:6851689-Lingulodinium_polyedra.AAC.1
MSRPAVGRPLQAANDESSCMATCELCAVRSSIARFELVCAFANAAVAFQGLPFLAREEPPTSPSASSAA